MEIQRRTMTATDKANYEKELEQLRIERQEVIKAIADARSLGDLSENDEYKQAKDREARVNGRMQEIDELLKTAVIVEDSPAPTGTVSIGSVVKVYDAEFEEEDTFTLVGVTETDPANGMISAESPIGAALIGAQEGDEVTAVTPSGEIKLKVLEISSRQ